MPALWEGLLSGRSSIRRVERFDPAPYRTQLAAEVPAGPVLDPLAGAGRRLSLADRFALVATAEALAGAGLPERLDELEAGVFFGSSTGGMLESEEFYCRMAPVAPMAPIAPAERDRPVRRSALGLLAVAAAGGPGDAVARVHGVRGPVATVASACASATLALGSALDALRAGEVDLALVGGSDSLCRLTFAGFNSLRAVDALPCRPFRVERTGMTIGEGAAVLVLETRAHAARRGAAPLGWLAGAGASCDAHHMTSPDPEGAGIARAVAAALADAGLDARAIDFVNLHGTGTPPTTRPRRGCSRAGSASGRCLPSPPPRAAIGHYLGAAGAIEAVATLLGLVHGIVHPTPGEGTVEEALGVDLVVGAPRALPGARRALSTNLAFGGANAACVLLHPEAA